MKPDLFDCNVQVGRFAAPVPDHRTAARSLAESLSAAGIRRGLAHSALARDLHPAEGNPALLKEIEGLPFAPCWVAMPGSTGEMPRPGEFVAQMKSAGVKAVRLFPSWHQYVLADWCAGELLDEFEANRVPVFVDAGQTSYDHLAAVLASHPDLRLVLVRTGYRCDRYIYPLMEKYAGFAIEISNYAVTGGIEAICSRFGASRLLFGTASPFYEPGAAVSLVTYADISAADKQLIASGNLEKLLDW